MNFKTINGHQKAALRFLDDLGNKGVITYNINDFSAGHLPSVYTPSYLNKCTHATVALSGCAGDQNDYMIICPYRVDRNRSAEQMVYDFDPVIIGFDSIDIKCYESALIGYHQDFLFRTTPISGVAYSDILTAVKNLKHKIHTNSQPLSSIPYPVESALHHMAKYFREIIA